MLEYLIRAADGGDSWFDIHADRIPTVLSPAGWNTTSTEGWGEYRFRLDNVEVALSVESAGWQVAIEGDIDAVRADLLIEMIAQQIEIETGRPTQVVRL